MPIIDQLRQRDLTYAIANAALEDVKRALAAGSDPNLEPLGSDYHSPLEHAFAEHCAGRPHMEAIIRELLKAGVSPEVRRETLFRASIELGNRRQSARNPYARRVTPERLRDFIAILKNYEPGQHDNASVVKKQPTAAATIQMWHHMLFSEKFSDVQFQFEDNTVVHAHKCVLAAASPYFDNYFSGPWGKNHPDGVWKTTNSVPIMKAVLTYIYTGSVDMDVLLQPENLSHTLSLAVQYQLPDLQKLVEASLKKALQLVTLKDTLVTAQMHSLMDLKAACFDFIRTHSLSVMFEPSIMSMAQEYPDLWMELAETVGGRKNSNKRPRPEDGEGGQETH
ncbi:RCC1 and BTB domain-containing protein 1 [Seminavis robusta]|uniref:RCC1 and BTB domain-containing protein 1 n=1 Tax=Seminavis robusta TaxID=568900 RepID=A0A9N8HR93_9STRA|nr:RCC1 and BTB domain-containing protein 1 [Seminavis robusta]|eukprot:Sro1368_g266850.1 RCC1 and BTB domain-containing protein 1 (337) ;mRNA; r:28156-29166